ncbi:hypothetical protein CTEN210_16319 [Chaetoceros tenuissimus]|uniref:UDP-N-acetylglucosamine diphosphorylase n=1 Tax=Chaetoceros tenuissimus TaxID=426638 RepID=A0AAD3HDP9_9STRA|nr:hypothetical protein CTEN210_16316 [Chaetoceros tenuissimus]GFH59843.1 hypothetical protein CTEN210_16319 [Chaetoceros tenuissimus]
MESRKEELFKKYEAEKQQHVFQYWDDLTPSQQTSLLDQLESIEVEKLNQYLTAAKNESKDLDDNIQPFSGQVGKGSTWENVNLYETGMKAIQENQVAAVLLAGGQGTRLGYDGPKGKYDICLPSKTTLFGMIAQRLVKLCQLAKASAKDSSDKEVTIPLYIMTSPMNHKETEQYFISNDYFGLGKSNVTFFAQGVLPCLAPDGKILMETPYQCCMAPDGNGGIYPAMQKCGVLDDIQKRGIQHIHTFAIDNSLVKPADPKFIGYCIHKKADCGNKVLWKSDPHEKVGVIAEKDGKPCVVEYSELSKDMAERVDTKRKRSDSDQTSGDDSPKLAFGAANICNHYYHLNFLQEKIIPNLGNMMHIANKKIGIWDSEKNATVKPDSNNGIKLESFIFDVFPLSTSMAIYEVERKDEFAPVKNAPGASSDSPDTARAMISSLSKEWLIQAGATLKEEGSADCICEITPMTSYGGEGLDSYKGKEVVCPFVL